jgi:4-amino-4-deoxy-L-arabinose transferase-like glycosyltransferase
MGRSKKRYTGNGKRKRTERDSPGRAGRGAQARSRESVDSSGTRSPEPFDGWGERIAGAALIVFAIVLLWTVLIWHTTPLYTVETDLIGETIPAAKALASGEITGGHFLFKGPGYPLLLAVTAFTVGGDYFLAARLLNVAAAVVALWFAFLLFRRFLGTKTGLFVLLGLAFNPVFVRATVEAGTDMPAMALALIASYLVLCRQGTGFLLVAGLVAGYAVVTRYNNAFLLLAAVPVLAWRPARWSRLAAFGAGFVLPVGSWMAANQLLTGNAFTNLNYVSVAYGLYGQDTTWDRFFATVTPRFQSLTDVLSFDPATAAKRIGLNLVTNWLKDIEVGGCRSLLRALLCGTGAGLLLTALPSLLDSLLPGRHGRTLAVVAVG